MCVFIPSCSCFLRCCLTHASTVFCDSLRYLLVRRWRVECREAPVSRRVYSFRRVPALCCDVPCFASTPAVRQLCKGLWTAGKLSHAGTCTIQTPARVGCTARCTARASCERCCGRGCACFYCASSRPRATCSRTGCCNRGTTERCPGRTRPGSCPQQASSAVRLVPMYNPCLASSLTPLAERHDEVVCA